MEKRFNDTPDNSISTITESTITGTSAADDDSAGSPGVAGIKRLRRRKTAMLFAAALLFSTAAIIIMMLADISGAYKLYEQGRYTEAKSVFSKYTLLRVLDEMSDLCDDAYKEQQIAVDYEKAMQLYNDGDYIAALELFEYIPEYKDSLVLADECVIKHFVDLYQREEYFELIDYYVLLQDPPVEATAYCLMSYFYIIKENDSVLSFEMELRFLTALMALVDETDACYADDLAEVLSDPYLYYTRLKDVRWDVGEYFIDLRKNEDGRYVLKYNLPFNKSDDNSYCSIRVDEDNRALCFDSPNGEMEFCITGFDTYDVCHPNMVYLMDAEGEAYVFFLNTEANEF